MSTPLESQPAEQLAWLAGLLEGEGYFALLPVWGKQYKRATVSVEMTDEDVVRKVAEMFGTHVHTTPAERKKGNRQASYQTIARGLRAAKVMQAVRPLMCERRAAVIDDVLAQLVGTKQDPAVT